MSEKWFVIMIIGLAFIGLGAITISSFSPESNQESPYMQNKRFTHEKEMFLLQRDTMPKDSIIVIQGNKYKLEKYE